MKIEWSFEIKKKHNFVFNIGKNERTMKVVKNKEHTDRTDDNRLSHFCVCRNDKKEYKKDVIKKIGKFQRVCVNMYLTQLRERK